jgi:hypothetical protein
MRLLTTTTSLYTYLLFVNPTTLRAADLAFPPAIRPAVRPEIANQFGIAMLGKQNLKNAGSRSSRFVDRPGKPFGNG